MLRIQQEYPEQPQLYCLNERGGRCCYFENLQELKRLFGFTKTRSKYER